MDNKLSFFSSYVFWLCVVCLTLYQIYRTGRSDPTSVIAGLLADIVICGIICLIYKAFSKRKEEK